MNRRSFLACWFAALGTIRAMEIGAAWAARLPLSTVTVDVLSVERESFNREEYKYPGMATSAMEISSYVAKARIVSVLHNEHELSAGSIIEVRYTVRVRQPPHPSFHVGPTLRPGASATLTVFGRGSAFEWQRPSQ